MHEAISANIKRIKNFFHFTKNYFIRNNPIKAFMTGIEQSIKDVLTIRKKQKLVKYRLNYQMGKLKQMEKLIAANNDHVFLRGRKFNETR
ncbi:TPA: hypothetical protein IAA82_07615 [Candidatus Galligastranaerophilus gallistercoris]|nr:hypothetical protein [Candidatus Galligastranaerophilus gallistercoris]